jgi:hypothetical protein
MVITDPKGTEPINKTTPARNEQNLPAPEVGANLVDEPHETPAHPMNPATPAKPEREPDQPAADQNKVD